MEDINESQAFEAKDCFEFKVQVNSPKKIIIPAYSVVQMEYINQY
jgi:hypothetical protein